MANLHVLKELVDSTERLKDRFSNIRLFAIQHLFEDTEEWLHNLVELGMEIDVVIGIEYSAKRRVVKRLINKGIRVVTPPFSDMHKVVKNLLSKSLKECKVTNKKLLIAEVGGYAVPVLHKDLAELASYCIGAIEETRHGIWLDEQIDKLLIPIFQTAETPLKKLESIQVGEAVVAALQMILRDRGLSMAGWNAYVLGFGWIGASVANALRNRYAIVYCYDINPLKIIEAHLSGFGIGSKECLMGNSDIIIGATGRTSLTRNDLLNLKEGTYLASASSKQVEIGLNEIQDHILRRKTISTYVDEIELKNHKKFYLIADGFPVNFILNRSVSVAVMDMIFSSVFACMVRIVENNYESGIYAASEEDEKNIATLWMQQYL